jgi:hypothetical protein
VLALALGPWMVAYAQLLARAYSRCCYGFCISCAPFIEQAPSKAESLN